MAGTLQTRIEVYTGTISDTSNLTDLINAGIRSIINAIPEYKLEKYATANTDSGSGVDVSNIRLIRAHKNGYSARKIDAGLKTQVLPSGAISSVAIASGGTGYSVDDVLTLTTGGSSGTCKVLTAPGGVVGSVSILTAGSGYSLGISNTTVAPAGGSGCILYVVPSNGSIHQATITDPVWYIEATKGYVIPSGGTILGVTIPSSIVYSSTTIGTFPIEFEQTVILYVAIQELIGKSNALLDTLTALNLSSTIPPSVPISPSYTYSDAELGVYSPTTISSLPTAPNYISPVCSLTNAPNDLVISVVAPTIPDVPVYSYSDAVLGTYSATTIGSFGSVPTYIKPSNSVSFTNVNTYIGAKQDLERAQTEISNQQAQIALYNSDISNGVNGFNSQVEEYRANIQRQIRQAELDQEKILMSANKTTDLSLQNKAQQLSASIATYKDGLQRYLSAIDSYKEQVNKEVNLYRANLDKWTVDRQTQLSLY